MSGFGTDVLVVGAGPAGIAAALRSESCGAKVLLLDDNPTPGGQIWRGRSTLWTRRLRRSGIQLIQGAQVIGGDAGKRRLLVQLSSEALTISYRDLILATGARELFLPFPGWTLPGIMGAGGLQAMATGGMSVRGKRVAIGGSGPLLLAVAAHLRQAGANVVLVAEQTPRNRVLAFARQLGRRPGKLLQAGQLRLLLAGAPYRFGCWVRRAEGDGRLRRLQITDGQDSWTEPCDIAGIAYGLVPNIELGALLGCKIERHGVIQVDENQHTGVPGVYAAGECTGIGGVDLAVVEGELAGFAVTGRLPSASYLFRARARAQHFATQLARTFALRSELHHLPEPDTIVCRCEDVRWSELAKLPSFRAGKLLARCGMGPCQARVCGPATQFLFGWQPESVRPPLFPAPLGSLIETSS